MVEITASGIGNRASEFTIASILPPTGTLMIEHVEGSAGSLHTVTGRCGPAPLNGKTRSESAPPEKYSSLRGTKLPENGVTRPNRNLLAQVSQGRIGK